MPRPLFSDMLFERRRQLGLSIKQASNVLRLKEEVLVAFEEGDFDSIPKSGYAQGMLSSYARYLGLNAKTVVSQFQQDLIEHERGAGSHEARRNRRHNRGNDDGPLYETPQANNPGQGGTRRTYVESRGFLPTSGGFAGDMGEFATTSPARPRYRSDASADNSGSLYYDSRPYTPRASSSATLTPLGQPQRAVGQSGYGAQAGYGSTYGGAYGSRYGAGRHASGTSQYRDDPRSTGGDGYRGASSSSGRRSSRNIGNTARSDARRRGNGGSRSQGQRSRGSQDGILGMIQDLLSDRSRIMMLVMALIVLVLLCIVFFTVRSCESARQSTGRSVTVTAAETGDDDSGETSGSDDKEKDDETDAEEERARAEAVAAKAAENDQSATERTIEITVAEKEVTWLEVEYDGTSDIAQTVTGPWNRTYTVRQSISVKVNNTTAVTVTEGGKKLEFDDKASGIGTITIQVSKRSDGSQPPTDGTSVGGTSVGSTADGTSADGQTSTDGQQPADGQVTTDGQQTSGEASTDPSTNGQAGQQPTVTDGTAPATPTDASNANPNLFEGYTLDADGYYYGPDGYYDANGTFYSY